MIKINLKKQNTADKYSVESLSVKITDRNSQLTYYVLNELAEFEQWKLERELSLLKVDLEILWRPFGSLSGGEQTKCLLAILFLDEDNFPLIDEPTNHLDLESRKIVADYLQKKSGFIVVSHDRNFLDEVCDHTLAIERQQIVLYQEISQPMNERNSCVMTLNLPKMKNYVKIFQG